MSWREQESESQSQSKSEWQMPRTKRMRLILHLRWNTCPTSHVDANVDEDAPSWRRDSPRSWSFWHAALSGILLDLCGNKQMQPAPKKMAAKGRATGRAARNWYAAISTHTHTHTGTPLLFVRPTGNGNAIGLVCSEITSTARGSCSTCSSCSSWDIDFRHGYQENYNSLQHMLAGATFQPQTCYWRPSPRRPCQCFPFFSDLWVGKKRG